MDDGACVAAAVTLKPQGGEGLATILKQFFSSLPKYSRSPSLGPVRPEQRGEGCTLRACLSTGSGVPSTSMLLTVTATRLAVAVVVGLSHSQLPDKLTLLELHLLTTHCLAL